MALALGWYSACMGPVWDPCGICMGSAWVPMGSLMGLSGVLHRIPLGIVWDWDWTLMGFVRNLY